MITAREGSDIVTAAFAVSCKFGGDPIVIAKTMFDILDDENLTATIGEGEDK
jgi:hypothetical protein